MHKNSKKLNINNIRFILLVLVVFSIIYGILRGEIQIVLRNAINICLDCIGIG